MHVIFRESHGLDEADTPRDLAQTPADLLVLSYSDSDLSAFAAAWHRGKGALPSLRLANCRICAIRCRSIPGPRRRRCTPGPFWCG